MIIDNDINSMYAYRMQTVKVGNTWQSYLRILQSRHTSWTKLGQNSESDGLDFVTKSMQERFPGKYTIVEGFDPERGTMSLKVKFEDSKEELMWKLRWS